MEENSIFHLPKIVINNANWRSKAFQFALTHVSRLESDELMWKFTENAGQSRNENPRKITIYTDVAGKN